jgi:elongation factor Ts
MLRACLSSTTEQEQAEQPSIPADLIKRLRDRTGAPIVDVKRALIEKSNDIHKAADWLRETGAVKAATKVAGRVSAEGLVAIRIAEDGKSAAVVKVASETDFAGRSAQFVDLVTKVATATLDSDKTGRLEEETILQAQADGKSVKTLLDDAIVAIRENLKIEDAIKLTSDDGVFIGYVHNRVDAATMAGTSAALVELLPLSPDVTDETLQEVGKRLAMHIVAFSSKYMTRDDVPESVVERERRFLTTEVIHSGSPANMMDKIAKGKLPEDFVEKIVLGKLRKYFEKICLLEQHHAIEYGFPKIGKFLEEKDIAIRRYERLTIMKDLK